jgi:DNA-binding transcriptional ArsR family regulator
VEVVISLKLTDVLQAIAVESRLAILRLVDGDRYNVRELAAALEITPSAASSHARVLRRAGLVDGQMTGRDKHYVLTALGTALLAALDDVADAHDVLI